MISSDIRLFDTRDVPWIAQLLDIVDRSLGEPWRVLLARVDEAGLTPYPARVQAMVRALRMFGGGRAQRGRVARRVRTLVLGHPALDRDERDARLAAAACLLGITPSDVEQLLWIDIAKERPVTLPAGRPNEMALLAVANLDRIQRALHRAREVRIRIVDAGHDLVRAVARYGLIAEISRDGESTVLDLAGPLSLFHATTVYGRALGALVPQLAGQSDFALDVTCEFDGQLQRLHVESPVALPPLRDKPKRRVSALDRLSTALLARGHTVIRDPTPLVNGSQLLFPELLVDGTYVELIGFATAAYLDARLAAYRAAGITEVRLCIDTARLPDGYAHPDIVVYAKTIDPERITCRSRSPACSDPPASPAP